MKGTEPGLMPSVFGDVTGAMMVMPCMIILLQFHNFKINQNAIDPK